MVRAGAAIVDVGGESTRPGATPVTPDEEWDRIGEVVRGPGGGRHLRVGGYAPCRGGRLAPCMPALPSSTTCLVSAIPPWCEAVRRCGCGLRGHAHEGRAGHHAGRPRLRGRGGRSARLPARCGRRLGGGRHRPLPHLRRSGPRLRQDAQADHRAHAQPPRDRPPGLSGHGGGLAQALRGRGLPCGRASRPRRGLRGRGAARLRAGRERGAHPQRRDDGRGAEGPAAGGASGPGLATWRSWPSPARRPRPKSPS